jgi:hypothetical protein
MPNHKFSRREFARRAAIASAATLIPATAFSTTQPTPLPTPQQPGNTPPLSAASQAEADNRTQSVLAQYSSHLSDEQKPEIARLSTNIQRQLDTLRKFPTENGDDPALYLKPLMEREKKPVPNPATAKSAATIKPAPAAPKN